MHTNQKKHQNVVWKRRPSTSPSHANCVDYILLKKKTSGKQNLYNTSLYYSTVCVLPNQSVHFSLCPNLVFKQKNMVSLIQGILYTIFKKTQIIDKGNMFS